MTLHPAIQYTAGILAIIAALAALFVIPLGLDLAWENALDAAAGLLGGIAAGTTLINIRAAANSPTKGQHR